MSCLKLGRHSRFILFLFLFALAACEIPTSRETQSTRSDADLIRAVYNQMVAAINEKDVEALSALWHDNIVVFGVAPLARGFSRSHQKDYSTIAGLPSSPPRSVFVRIGDKLVYRQAAQQFFEAHASISIQNHLNEREIIPSIAGATGILRTMYTMEMKPKKGPVCTQHYELMLVLTKDDGKWLVASEQYGLTAGPVFYGAFPPPRERWPKIPSC